MHQGEARAQQRVGLALGFGAFEAFEQRLERHAALGDEIAAVGAREMTQRQGQIVGEARVRHHMLGREQHGHGQPFVRAHEALAEVLHHRGVVDLDRRVVALAARAVPRRAAGHEDARGVHGRATTERQVFEGVDRHGGDIAPAGDRRGHASAQAAEALKELVPGELIGEEPERQRLELILARTIGGDKIHHRGNNLRLPHRPRPRACA